MNPADYQPRDFLWSQRDYRWASKHLGTSSLTVGHYGCAALCVNYLVNRAWLKKGLARFARPGEFVDWCNTHSKFTPGGAIYWDSANYFSSGYLKLATKATASYRLMEVVWGQYHHWVVLLNGDLCYDPWDGKIKKRVQPIWYPSGRYQYYA